MSKLKAHIKFNEEQIKRINEVPQKIRDQVFPQALAKAALIVKSAIKSNIRKYADGDKPNPNDGGIPSRNKQSKSAKERFPTKMVDHVGIKTASDYGGILKIVGVTNEAAHVNFDHGDKAKTAGRLHKFWWRANGPNKTPRLRRQTHDIKMIVRAEVATTVTKIITDDIEKAIKQV